MFFSKKITTQSRLADELKIHRGNMNKFVKERVGFSEDRKELIAKHLGFTYMGMLELGRKLMGHEPFYWAMREVWLDKSRRAELLEKLGVEEKTVFNPLRKMLFKESMKTAIVEALGTSLDEMVERGKIIMLTEPSLAWDLNNGFQELNKTHEIPWKDEPTEPASPSNDTLGSRLKEIRDEWGMTQKGMANKLGLGLSSYQCYERSQRDIPASVLLSLVGFGVDAAWLLTGSMEEAPKKVAGLDDIIEHHFDIVRRFKNREEARDVNRDLLALEQISEKAFFKATSYIAGLLDAYKDTEDELKQDGVVAANKKTGNG